MGITISGENNNDRILATDGVIDQLSGFNVVGVITATSFTGDLTGDVTGNLTGNVTGNVTGNINNSTLLLQTGGSERIRITGNNEIGIAGANYGSAGQVLTSGGSGSAVSWTTISGTTINSNVNNYLITGTGTANTLQGEQRLTYNGSSFTNANVTSSEDSAINVYKATGDNADKAILRVGYDETNSFKVWRPRADAHIYMETSQSSSDIIINTNNGSAIGERLRIDASGRVMIGNSDAGNLYASGNNLVVGSGGASNQGITIYTGDVQQGILAFADGTSGGAQQYAGYMIYDHNTNNMLFATQATERLRITSGGDIQVRSGVLQRRYESTNTAGYRYYTKAERAIVPHGGSGLNFTITGMNQGFASLRFGGYSEGNRVNFRSDIGGFNASDAGVRFYESNEITNQAASYSGGASCSITVTKNNASYVVNVTQSNPQNNSMAVFYYFETGGYNGVSTLTVS